jgi:hypothetical protein
MEPVLPPEKNNCKIFSTVMKNGKSFSERFLRQLVCPSINRRSVNGVVMDGCYRPLIEG